MATFAPTQQTFISPNAGNPQRYYSYGHFSPRSMTPPSSSVSPTNNHSNAHPKQVRQPKQVFYIPAVLRPTEMCPPKSRRPLTPPRSAHSSLDSQGATSGFAIAPQPLLPLSPIEDMPAFFNQFGPIARVVTDEWNEELGNVTGQPTRNHWKPDSTASCCTSPTCSTVFTFLARRHHCRRCGNIFCSPHSAHTVPLDQEARFHPEGTPERSCDLCWADFQTWRRARNSRANSIASADTSSTAHPSIARGDSAVMGINNTKNDEEPAIKGVSQLRNEDWNWSTF